ncbi:P-loop containing nucleoside triphosphate hydrolase protein [Suillus placidus]|uniref:P-loop containing nucleoside triphosphate hydrolase protein n=1 Tax=Suillus placidus TaxID=48579 RepID=A0A9P6ZSQ5_9AGAM|nr:P-loop containing nucleoside triphosphate hydrolase protein [Suillus placidus]
MFIPPFDSTTPSWMYGLRIDTTAAGTDWVAGESAGWKVYNIAATDKAYVLFDLSFRRRVPVEQTRHFDRSGRYQLDGAQGELVGVLGRVGSRKSSLLSSIIGDMRKTEGEVALFRNVAYAAQNPWILSATVRDNILFSHEYDEVFYNLVIEGMYMINYVRFGLTFSIACALKPDLELLSQGDLTEVGEKGITLSGGQRARVALTRAIYARADLVLLDDVLAASIPMLPDMSLVNHVIGPQGLLATKARILVTNSISYLKYFDHLVYLRRGIILESGSYNELMSNPDGEVRKLVAVHNSGTTTPGRSSGMATPTTSEGDMQATLVGELECVSEKVLRRGSFKKAVLAAPPKLRDASSDGITKEHTSRKGFLFFVLATVLQQAVSVMSTAMLRLWGEHNRKMGANVGLTDKYFLGYGLFNLIGACAALLIWVFCSLRSSKHLHDSVSVAFHDTGLVGLVLSCALNTTGSLNWFVRSVSEVEQNVVSVERIVHYAKDLEPEAPYEIPASGWSTAGEVEFREYPARYRPGLDLVLKDISMALTPKEKIGICGRTGAGKSSLLLALFQIIEPASGTIFIDKVDITKTSDGRSKLIEAPSQQSTLP